MRLLPRIRKTCRDILSFARLSVLRISAWMEGGRLEIRGRVRVHHSVRFIGRGTAILEDGVTLGYRGASATRSPILIEPREPNAVIRIGSGCTVVNGTEMLARERIEIGKDSLIGPRCVLMDSDFHEVAPDRRREPGLSAPIALGENVWLGCEVMVLKGVEIGRDAVVGARAVVTRSIAPGGIVLAPRPVVVGSVYDTSAGQAARQGAPA